MPIRRGTTAGAARVAAPAGRARRLRRVSVRLRRGGDLDDRVHAVDGRALLRPSRSRAHRPAPRRPAEQLVAAGRVRQGTGPPRTSCASSSARRTGTSRSSRRPGSCSTARRSGTATGRCSSGGSCRCWPSARSRRACPRPTSSRERRCSAARRARSAAIGGSSATTSPATGPGSRPCICEAGSRSAVAERRPRRVTPRSRGLAPVQARITSQPASRCTSAPTVGAEQSREKAVMMLTEHDHVGADPSGRLDDLPAAALPPPTRGRLRARPPPAGCEPR